MWTRLETADVVSEGLLELAVNDPVLDDRYFYGAMFTAANSGPRGALATDDDDLRLYAVLAVYQAARFPGANPAVWDGCVAHVRRAFEYANSIGRVEVARRLRQSVVDHGLRSDPPEFAELMRRSSKGPAADAAHERRMASILHRDIRAADLLDPEGAAHFDGLLLDGRLDRRS